nr:T5orf172 domain-containing protein [Kaumoebavirus]
MSRYIYVVTNEEPDKDKVCKIGRHKGDKNKLDVRYKNSCTPTIHLFELATTQDETNLKRIMYDIRKGEGKYKLERVNRSATIIVEYVKGYLQNYGEETYSYYQKKDLKKVLDKLMPRDFATMSAKDKEHSIKKVPFDFYYKYKVYDRRKIFEWYLKVLNDKTTEKDESSDDSSCTGSDRSSDEDFEIDELSYGSEDS